MNQIADIRMALKVKLMKERREPGGLYICAGCGHLTTRAVDLHEILVTKGDVEKGSDELREAINCAENCGFIERRCHETNRYGQLNHLLRYTTKAKIYAFLDKLIELGAVKEVIEERRRIIEGA